MEVLISTEAREAAHAAPKEECCAAGNTETVVSSQAPVYFYLEGVLLLSPET